ncbi:MAG: 5-formyltetrahydrofolate cyclo-ligase [Pseudomonadota bacterium]
MSDVQSFKAQARKAAFAARKEAHAQGLDIKANSQLTAYLKELPPDKTIAGYMPIRTEVTPLLAMAKAYARGHRICVPVVIAAGSPLEFHEWTPNSTMVAGAFGAAVPEEGALLIPDIVITPLVAFDRSGYRLGYGGGFYDRSFAELSEMKKISAVGFAYDAQELMMIPREDTDYPLDAIVTERGILRF